MYRTTADFNHLHQTACAADDTDPVEVIRTCTRSLATIPDAVQVTAQGGTITVQVHPSDVGRLIGAGGKNARALRTLLTAICSKQQRRYALDLPNPTGQAG